MLPLRLRLRLRLRRAGRWTGHALAAVALAAAAGRPAAAAGTAIEAVFEMSPYSEAHGPRVTGPGPDLVEALLRRAGITDRHLGLYPWARAYELALKVPNVLLFGVARTPEREHRFQWIGELFTLRHDVYRLRSRPDIAFTTPDDARRYSIGVKRHDVLQKLLQDAGYRRLVVSDRDADTFRKLLAGEVELMPLAPADAADLCRDRPADCAGLERMTTPIGPVAHVEIAFSLGTPEATVARVRAAFDSLRADGSIARWMGTRR